MSNSLVKLIDNSLFPAVLIIFCKFIGIYLFALLFNVSINFETSASSFFSFQTSFLKDDLLTISSYSDLFMFTAVALGFVIVLIKSTFFHENKVSVAVIARLAEFNLLSLIKNSWELYHTAVTWFIFTWIANMIILVDVLIGRTYYWIIILTTFFCISLSVVLFRDVIKETELSKKQIFSGGQNDNTKFN